MQLATTQPPAETVGYPFPNLPESVHPMFWVAALLRDQAILVEFAKETRKFWGGLNLPLSVAMTTAESHLRQDVHDSAKEAKQAGVLLFCHAETTVLNGGSE